MPTEDFTISIAVSQSPADVFNAVANVRGWWSENIEGDTDKEGAVFKYHYADVHRCKIKIVECIPDRKIVWDILDNYFDFTHNPHEWRGDKITFDITRDGNNTRLRFTQHGLVPACECFSRCASEWTAYVQKSIYDLITKGRGRPEPKEEQ